MELNTKITGIHTDRIWNKLAWSKLQFHSNFTRYDSDLKNGITETRHVFVKHGCPRRQQSRNMAKSQILTLPHPQGRVMSVRCEQPLDELTVQVWLLYDHPNFKYCTLYISGTELRTNGQTNGRTDGWTDGRSKH